MNRRNFLTTILGLSATGLAATASRSLAKQEQPIYRVMAHRRLVVSYDGGHKWQNSLILGADETIQQIQMEHDRTAIVIDKDSYHYRLWSTDGAKWRI